jgi:hypothetical protein
MASNDENNTPLYIRELRNAKNVALSEGKLTDFSFKIGEEEEVINYIFKAAKIWCVNF